MCKQAIFCFFIFCLSICKTTGIPIIDSTDFPEAKFFPQEQYGANSLWGYMNGGAELYREYGFQKLTVQKLELNNMAYKIEYYLMENRQSAFGIFSILRFRCNHSDTLPVIHCISKQQLQLVYNSYYISVSSNKHSDTNTKDMLQLAKCIVKNDTTPKKQRYKIFGDEKFFSTSKSLTYIKGELALQNSFIKWQNFFEDLQNFHLYLQPVLIHEKKCYVSKIEFFNVDDLNKFLQNSNSQLPVSGSTAETRMDGKLFCLKPVDDLMILWIEIPVKDTDIEATKQEILSFFRD